MEEKPPSRLTAFDQVKGVAILCVILIHVTSHASNAYYPRLSAGWWAHLGILHTISFAVPVFLCASAFLWTLSAVKKPLPWLEFWKRRGISILHPYIVFTSISFFIEVKFIHPPASREAALKLLGTDLLWGKAMYHLYFMSILLQFLVLFPALYYLISRAKMSFVQAFGAAFVLEFGFYEYQHYILKFVYPATLAVWHLMLFIPAMWLALNWEAKGREVVTSSLLLWIGTALASGGYYLWGMSYELRNLQHWGLGTNLAIEIYGLSVFLALVALFLKTDSQAEAAPNRASQALTWLGINSLPIYLLHPYVLSVVTIGRFDRIWKQIPGQILIVYALTLGITLAVTYAFRLIQADRLLWGPLLRPNKIASTTDSQPA